MKFKELFEEVEDWFWKLEFNPEKNVYELYLGIPNDWVYNKNGKGITIEAIHELEENSIIKISTEEEILGVDEIIETAKNLILKNKELEKKKEEHRLEMEKLKELLIEKEKNFLEFIDQVKDDTLLKKEEVELVSETENNNAVNDTESDIVKVNENEIKENFINDIEKLKLT